MDEYILILKAMVEERLTYIATGLAVVLAALLIILFNKSKKETKKIALDSEKWQPFKLVQVDEITHDVKRFRFALQSPEHVLGLPIGQHISLKYSDENGKEIIRSYTPTSSDVDIGYVDFVIKVYFKTERFPNGGLMSQYVNNLKINDTILMKGPKGHLEYLGKGKLTIKKRSEVLPYKVKKMGFVCGGTGITPMLQVIRAIQRDPTDNTEVWLIFANQSEADILLREELDSLPKDRFHLWYTVDRAAADWKYSTGFVNTEMCKNHLPSPAADTMLFVCGPPPMVKYACEPAFKELGFQESQWFCF